MSIVVGRQTTKKRDPFSAAWLKMYHIFGWLTEGEARALFDAAMGVSEDGLIIEVGAFRGRSTALLAGTGRYVLTVDPLVEGTTVAKLPVDESVVAALRTVIGSYPNIVWARKHSTEATCPNRAGMLYIDGVHRYPSPLDDFKHFRPALSQGAIVAFHDYGREFGVTKSVDELEGRGIISRRCLCETMYIGEIA